MSTPAGEPDSTPAVEQTGVTAKRSVNTRRYVGIGMLLLGLAIVIGGLWVIVTGLLARSQLQAAKADVATLRAQVSAGNLSAATSTAADLRKHADQADLLTAGPAWAIASAVPGGSPFGTVRALTQQLRVLSFDVISPLVGVSDSLDPQHIVKPGGRVDLGPLQRAAPVLDAALPHVASAERVLADRPSSSWAGPVDSARSTLLDQVTALRRLVQVADTAARVTPTLLGADGPKRYFVGFQNDAEMRGTGGLPGAFGILLADHGVLKFERFENDGTLVGLAVNVPLGADYDRTFAGAGTELDYRDTNLSPNFPYAAQLWMAMWQKKSGQHLDGAVTLDPTALSYLLQVTGPVAAKNGVSVSAGNVVDLTQREVYSRYPHNNNARKAFLLDVAQAASTGAVNYGASTDLIKAAARAVDERRLLLYSADRAVEQNLSGKPLAGEVPDDDHLYSAASIVNIAGNKLDYYLDRTIDYRASGCGANRTATVTIKLTNNAPTGLGDYVTGLVDGPLDPGYHPGDNRLLLSYYATHGATLTAATLDGKTALFYPHTLRNHPLWAFDLMMRRGATRTLVLTLHEPGSGPVDVFRQPGVRPLNETVTPGAC